MSKKKESVSLRFVQVTRSPELYAIVSAESVNLDGSTCDEEFVGGGLSRHPGTGLLVFKQAPDTCHKPSSLIEIAKFMKDLDKGRKAVV